MSRRKIDAKLKLYSFRLDSEVVNMLQSDYNVDLSAQLRHYLSNLLYHLILNDDKKVIVYTKSHSNGFNGF